MFDSRTHAGRSPPFSFHTLRFEMFSIRLSAAKENRILFLSFACILLSVSISNIWYLYTHLYTHIINKLLHGWFVCTIFIIHSLWRIAKLTRSLRSLVHLTILHNSWIKIVRTHQPWSNLYICIYNIAFVNSEHWLAKSRVDITLCQHGKFPATLLLKFLCYIIKEI